MARKKINPDVGQAALAAWQSKTADADTLAVAVRYSLEELAKKAPGNSVEVRVPPLGVVQCVEGPRHTRGTPPNTIEMLPETWLALAVGKIHWDEAIAQSLVSVSGTRATLRDFLPISNG